MRHKVQAAIMSLVTGAAILATSVVAGRSQNQEGPSGGRVTPEKPAAKKTVTKIRTTTAKVSKPPAQSSTGPGEKVDGKWWTTGNDFGQSQVVFTQTGNNVTGTITYSDGRTGNLSGTLAGKRLNYTWSNSAGDAGSGWLE